MGILLILAQVVLLVLGLLAHVVTLSLWVVFLPAILFGAMWLTGALLGAVWHLDSFAHPYNRVNGRRR